MELYNVDTSIPSIETDCLNVDEDETSKQILKSFHPVVLNELQPLNTRGDGNCLYRAVSLAISGSQKYYVKLKTLTALEIILNRSHYDTSSRQYNDIIKDDRVVTSMFNYLVTSAVKDGMYSELLHLYALSASLGRTIDSYYPLVISSTFHSEPSHRKVIGRIGHQSKPSCCKIMWTQTLVPKSSRDFNPNHFVPLCRMTPLNSTSIDLINKIIDTPKFHEESLMTTIREEEYEHEVSTMEIDSAGHESVNLYKHDEEHGSVDYVYRSDQEEYIEVDENECSAKTNEEQTSLPELNSFYVPSFRFPDKSSIMSEEEPSVDTTLLESQSIPSSNILQQK